MFSPTTYNLATVHPLQMDNKWQPCQQLDCYTYS